MSKSVDQHRDEFEEAYAKLCSDKTGIPLSAGYVKVIRSGDRYEGEPLLTGAWIGWKLAKGIKE